MNNLYNNVQRLVKQKKVKFVNDEDMMLTQLGLDTIEQILQR